MPFQWTKAGMLMIQTTDNVAALAAIASVGLDTSGLPFDWERVIGDMIPPTVAGYAAVAISSLSGLGPFADPVRLNTYAKFPNCQFTNTSTTDVDVTAIYVFKTAAPHDLWGMWVPDGALPFNGGTTIVTNILLGLGEPGQEFLTEVDHS